MTANNYYPHSEIFRLDAIQSRLLNSPPPEELKASTADVIPVKLPNTPNDDLWDLVEGTNERPVLFTRTFTIADGTEELQQHKFYYDESERAVELIVYGLRDITLQRYDHGLLTSSVERLRFSGGTQAQRVSTIWKAYDSNGRIIDQRYDSPSKEWSKKCVQSFQNYRTLEITEGADYLAFELEGRLEAFRSEVVSGMIETITKASEDNPEVAAFNQKLAEDSENLLATYVSLSGHGNRHQYYVDFSRYRSIPQALELAFTVADKLSRDGFTVESNDLMNKYFYQNHLYGKK